ncbi:MAG: hypothetical protein O3A46_02425 [Candidatus Poribacteria bacterium]|nr:hypothetical protein [Candidatus Poribacteria bacterium]
MKDRRDRPVTKSDIPTVQLIRDPRDVRELMTDVLGITLEAGIEDARRGIERSLETSNILGRRKREQAWRNLQEPLNRLLEEAFLYPMDPIPQPTDNEFPLYEPKLPPMPTLHRTDVALRKLIDAVGQSMPTHHDAPVPELRFDREPPLPPLPEPSFDDDF